MIFWSTSFPTGAPNFLNPLALTTGNLTEFFILNDEPDWSNPVDMSLETIIGSEESLDGKEARRPHGETPRVKLDYYFTATGQAARSAQTILRSWIDQPILCPLWPAVVEWGSRGSRSITGGLYVVFKQDWTAFNIYETTEPTVFTTEIGTVSRASNVATVATPNAKPHGLLPGMVTTISGVTAQPTFNAVGVTIISVSAGSFTYSNTGSNLGATSVTAGVFSTPINSDDLVAPLMWGRMQSRDSDWISGDAGKFLIKFEEHGPAKFGISATAISWAAGIQPSAAWATAGLTPDILDFRINFDKQDGNADAGTNVREQIGFRRDKWEIFYPYNWTESNPPYLDRKFTVDTLTPDQATAGRAIRFFIDHAIKGLAFFAPTWVSVTTLSSPMAIADTVAAVPDNQNVGTWFQPSDFICFLSPQGSQAPRVRKVTPIGTTALLLTTAIGSAWSVDDTLLSHAVLCKFDKPMLKLRWYSRQCAEVSFEVSEVPGEYTPAADETIGSTLGALPTIAYLYEFKQSGAIIERWTSFERDLVDLVPNTFRSMYIQHGDIRQGLFLDRDEVQIKASSVDTTTPTPLQTAMSFVASGRSELPLQVCIRKEVVDSVTGKVPTSPTYIFTGEIARARVKGSVVTGSAIPGGTLFDRKGPRARLQLGCNHAIFSTPCTLPAATWKFSGLVTAVAGSSPYTITMSTFTSLGALTPTFFASWLANGWAEWNGQRRAIIDSSLPVLAGACTITLERPFVGLTNGQTVFMFPGCDGRDATCKAYNVSTNPEGKFNNFSNFGGMNLVPATNPSLIKVSQSAGGAKK